MLDVKLKEIKFGHNLILKESTINADYGCLSVLSGMSGTGKSTILKALVFENEFINKYHLNDSDIIDATYEEKRTFVYEHISYLPQDTVFLRDLKVKDHIKLVKEMFNSNIDEHNWISILEISHCLEKYPTQLSGGEQIRVSILLSLLSDREIVIWDEPTSSLDEPLKIAVKNIINECLANGKMMIIATHDDILVEKAQYVYEIKDHSLNLIKDKKSENPIEKVTYKAVGKEKAFYHYFFKMKRHKHISEKIMYLMTTLCLSLLIFSCFFNNEVISSQEQQMNEIAFNEIILYKSPITDENTMMDYSYSGQGNSITDEELNTIRNLDHVESVEWRYDIDLNNPIMFNETDERFTNGFMNMFKLYQDEEILTSVTVYDSVILSTFLPNEEYKKDVKYQFQKEGVYISDGLANKLTNDISSLKGKQISFTLLVPVYNSYGKAWTETEDRTEVFLDIPSCDTMEVTFDIAGVLENSSMGIHNLNEHVIYIDRSVMEPIILDAAVDKSRTVYSTDLYFNEVYIDEIPKDKEVIETVIDTPWQPDAYTIQVDSISNLDEVIKQIKDMGLSVENGYINYAALSDSTKHMKTALLCCSGAIALILGFAYLAMKYTNRGAEAEINKYFLLQGYMRKEVKTIHRQKYIIDFCITSISLFVFLICFILLANSMYIGATGISLWMFVLLVLLSAFIEIIFPVLIERRTYEN